MFLDKEQLDQLEAHITEILPDLLRRNPKIATTIEGILAQHFPRRDEFARLLDEFTGFRQETRERFDRVDQDIHELKTDVGVLKVDVAMLKRDSATLKDEVGALKGSDLERKVRERAYVYLGRFALRLKAVSDAELAGLLEDAVEQGRLSEAEEEDAKLIDALARGRRRVDGVPIYLAVEVSGVVTQHDLERAIRRAALFEKATGSPTLPVVVGERTADEMREAAEQNGVGWFVLPQAR